MNLAAILIPPSLNPKQALRLRRFGVASLSYILATAMLAIGWMFDAIPPTTVFQAVGAFVALGTNVPYPMKDDGVLSWKNSRLLPLTGSCVLYVKAAITLPRFSSNDEPNASEPLNLYASPRSLIEFRSCIGARNRSDGGLCASGADPDLQEVR